MNTTASNVTGILKNLSLMMPPPRAPIADRMPPTSSCPVVHGTQEMLAVLTMPRLPAGAAAPAVPAETARVAEHNLPDSGFCKVPCKQTTVLALHTRNPFARPVPAVFAGTASRGEMSTCAHTL